MLSEARVGSGRGDVPIGAGFRTGREHLAVLGQRLLRGLGAVTLIGDGGF
jgi:hypothetical protein